MEIDISAMLQKPAFTYSHSAMEGGSNAGRNTWESALCEAAETVLLNTPEKIAAAKEFFAGFGAWDETEISAWTNTEVNALLIQMIAGDIREAGADNLESIDWDQYAELAEKGQISGRMFRGIDGLIYYYIGE